MSNNSESSIDINFENTDAYAQTSEMETKLRDMITTKYGENTMTGGAKKRKAPKKAAPKKKRSSAKKSSKLLFSFGKLV